VVAWGDVPPTATRGLPVKPTDIRIENVRFGYEDFRYRTPIKFGGVAVDRATLLNVECRVATRAGRSAVGFGSMPLGNVWSFPSRVLTYEQTLAAVGRGQGRSPIRSTGCDPSTTASRACSAPHLTFPGSVAS